MKQLNLKQGEAVWHAHRITARNASDAAAMLGCHPQKTRTQLLHEKKTGLAKQHSQFVEERVFPGGHVVEGKLRPVAEAIIGEEIYPVVGTAVVDGIELSASFDGLPLVKKENWECKSLNDELRAALPMPGPDGNDAANLPKYHRVQMQQQCMVDNLDRTLFTASDGNGDDRHCWYYPDADLGSEIVAGWKQFDIDLEAYVPVEVLDKPIVITRRPDQLPALRSSVKGELVLESNIKEWEEAALAYIKGVSEHELKTDEDFDNADEAAKWCVSSKKALEGVQASLMSATGDVNVAVSTIDRIVAELDKTRIAFTKKIDARKAARKVELLGEHQTLLSDHMHTLNARLGRDFMPKIAVDFAGAIHGKRSFDSMGAALNAALANAKIEANRIADKIALNLKALDAKAKDHGFLFNDLAQIVQMENDHFTLMVDKRISDHAAEQQRKDEATRERIRSEEKAKLERQVEVQGRIDIIVNAGKSLEGKTAADLEFLLGTVKGSTATPSQFDDRVADAQAAKDATIKLITEALEALTPPPAAAAPAQAAMADSIVTGTGITKMVAVLDDADGPPVMLVERVPPANVVPMRAAAPAPTAAPMTPPTMKLGDINALLSPIQLTADGLTKLGFPPAATDKSAKLYHHRDLSAMCAALHDLLDQVQAKQAA